MTRRDIVTAVPVAFAADGSLDLAGSRAILEYVAASGNEGAFVLGTTGEFPALDERERAVLTELSAEVLADTMRVIAHVGAASSYQARRLAAQAMAAGLREIAVLTPYYLPASDDGLVRYFTEVAEAAEDMDVFIYVFRQRTGNPVSGELMARLAAIPGVVGAKISGEPLAQVAAYRAVVPADFLLYTGADRELALAADSGAQGVVSGISSVLPKPFRELAAAADAGDGERLEAAQRAVDDAVDVIAGDMARMKAAYRLLGVTDATTRMAIDPPSPAELAEIARVVELYA